MSKKKTLAWARVSRRSVTPRDLSNTGSPTGFPKTREKKWEGLLRIKSAMLSLCLCECGPHSPIATTYADNDICSIEASLSQDLSNINHWLIANKLTLNMTKTEFMLIGSRQKLNNLAVLPALEINGTQLNRVNFTKSLGVLIDENLTWSNHINAISKKIFSGIGSIKRISHCVPPATLQNIYHGLVQSHFDYCSVVWGNCAKTLSDKLQKLQTRAVCILTHSSYDADSNQLITELGWDNLEIRCQKLKAEMVYKSFNGHKTLMYMYIKLVEISEGWGELFLCSKNGNSEEEGGRA